MIACTLKVITDIFQIIGGILLIKIDILKYLNILYYKDN